MVFVGTRYDKDLKEKVFYVRESEAYTHSTTTSLSVDWSDNVFTLTAVVDNLLGKGLVKFYRDGVEVGEQYVTRTATLLLQSDTYDGVFIAKFMGNSDCLSSESSEVSYKPLPTPEFSIVTSGDLLVGGKVTVGSSLPSDATGTVKYLVNGTEYTKTVGESFTCSFSSSGSFTLTAEYLGDSNYNVASASATLVISKVGTVLSVSCDKEDYYVTSTAKVSVIVKDKDGGVLGGVSVSDGSSTQITDSNGVASFTYENGSNGTVSKSYSFGGSDKYESSTGSVSWSVNLIPTVLTITSDKSSYSVGETATFTVSLKDEFGNSVGNVDVDIYDDIIGVEGKVTLDTDGTYTYTSVLDSVGSFTDIVNFSRNDVYNKSVASVSFSVVDTVTPELTLSAVDGLVGETGDILTFNVASSYTSGSVSLVDSDDGTVYYTSTIASDGTATLGYECKGLGDKNLVAQYNNGTNTFNSNIQSIEDCLIYDPLTSDKGDWYNDGATVSFTGTGLTISKSTSGEAHVAKTTPINTPFTFEYTWLKGTNQLFTMRLHNIIDSPTWTVYYYIFSNNYIGMGMTGNTTKDVYYGDMKEGDKIKLVVEATSVKGYVNDKLCVTQTTTGVPSQLYVGSYTNNGRSQTLKNMKVKPYTG